MKTASPRPKGDAIKLLRQFIPYYKPHLGLFAADMLCAVGSAAVTLVAPVVTRNILNEAIPSGDVTLLLLMGLVLVGSYCLNGFFQFFVTYWGHMMGVKMEARIRENLFAHLNKLSFSYYDDNRTGKIMSRLLNDLFDITELAHHGPENILISVIMLIGSVCVLAPIEWRLTLLVVAFMPIIVIFATTQRRNMREGFKQVRSEVGEINAQAENAISGIRVVQSFTNEQYEQQRFHKGNHRFQEAKRKSYKAMSSFETGMNLLTNLVNALVIIAGGYFVITGSIGLAELMLFWMYINLIIDPIRRLTGFTQQFEQGMSGFRRYVEIMEIEPAIQDKEGAAELTNVKGHIVLDHVTFSYDENVEVLHDLSIDIPAGKTLALVGPSGGGKTTLCQLIPRFYEVLEGTVTVDGVDIKDVTLQSLRAHIGMVQQDVFLFSGTFLENIRYGNTDATMEQVVEAAKRARIHDFIMSCDNGYDTDIGEKGVLLSGGQKQRLSIARAFLKNPPILILDEATSALDNETERQIQQALTELSRGRTTLVIAHRLSTIRNADKIVVLTADGMEDQGTHAELYARGGIYKRLYDAQFKE